MYTSTFFSVRCTTNWKHSAFLLIFEIKPDYSSVLWAWQQMECSVVSQSLHYKPCASFLTMLNLKIWQGRVI